MSILYGMSNLKDAMLIIIDRHTGDSTDEDDDKNDQRDYTCKNFHPPNKRIDLNSKSCIELHSQNISVDPTKAILLK